MKQIIFTLLISTLALTAKAQFGYNYSQYEFGLSGGITTPRTDFLSNKKTYAAAANFTYNYSPFINYIAEVQIGSIKAENLSVVNLPKYSINIDYSAVSFRAQLQMGELIDYSQSQFVNFFKNIYVSAGVGVIYSDLKVYDAGAFVAENKGSNVFIPLKGGYEFKFFNNYSEPRMKLDIGGQYNMVMSDAFDGINYGSGKDGFLQLIIGLKFALGGETSYRKPINY